MMFHYSPDNDSYPAEYKTEIYEQLKSLENERYVFRRRSPQFNSRLFLVKWLRSVFGDLEFCRVTLHLAVFLLDYFMDSHSIKSEKLTLMAALCLFLAGKFYEREMNVPKIPEINEILGYTYTKADIIYFEGIILKHFNWNLSVPTALHFVEFFMENAVIPADICKNCSNYNFVHGIIKSTVDDYLDVGLEDSEMIHYAPSIIAASCILAVRKSFNLQPVWPEKLEQVSEYTEEQLADCVSRISEFREKYQQKHGKRKLDDSPDHGYDSYETESSYSPNCLKSQKV